MSENIDIKKIFDLKRTAQEDKLYYYLAYKNETDKDKKLVLLKKLQELNESKDYYE